MENLPIVHRVYKKSISGFSLIEVLIFVSIASMFFVTVAAITTTALRDMKISEHKIVATRYAQELLSWIKVEKEDNWTNFSNRDITYGTVYCFNTDITNLTDWPTQGPCNTENNNDNYSLGVPPMYLRQATITVNNNSANILVEVKWREGKSILTVPINTILSVWE